MSLAADLYQHATDHYNDGGWDVIVECWTLGMIQDFLDERGAKTLADAIEDFEPLVDVWGDYEADAINSAF